MKQIIKLALTLFFILTICLIGFKIYQITAQREVINNRTESLLDFKFKTLKNDTFTLIDLNKNKKKILIHFNSECDLCQNEALKFKEKIHSLEDFQILYISSETPDKIKKFSSDFGLKNYETIIFLYDEDMIFQNWVGTPQVPYTLAYDENNNLIFRHKGLINFSQLLNALENEN